MTSIQKARGELATTKDLEQMGERIELRIILAKYAILKWIAIAALFNTGLIALAIFSFR